MPAEKAVRVDVISPARAANREASDQTGVSGPRSESPQRWLVLVGSLAGQEKTACSRVSGASQHLGQVVGRSSPHAGWARR